MAEAPATPATTTAAPKKKGGAVVLIIVGVIVFLFIVCGVVALLFGKSIINRITGTALENAIEESTGENVDIDTSDGTITIGDDEYTSSSTWPDDMPTSVPQFSGTISSSSKMTIDGQTSWYVSYTNTTETKVNNYKEDLIDDGWTTAYEWEDSSGVYYSLTKGDIAVTITFETSDNSATLTASNGYSVEY